MRGKRIFLKSDIVEHPVAMDTIDSRNSVIDNLLFLDTTHMFISITSNLWC